MENETPGNECPASSSRNDLHQQFAEPVLACRGTVRTGIGMIANPRQQLTDVLADSLALPAPIANRVHEMDAAIDPRHSVFERRIADAVELAQRTRQCAAGDREMHMVAEILDEHFGCSRAEHG